MLKIIDTGTLLCSQATKNLSIKLVDVLGDFFVTINKHWSTLAAIICLLLLSLTDFLAIKFFLSKSWTIDQSSFWFMISTLSPITIGLVESASKFLNFPANVAVTISPSFF